MSYSGSSYTPGKIVGVITLVFVLILAFAWVVGATWESMPPDKIGLHYTGGAFQGTHFKEIIQPGTGAKYYGEAENIYKLPSTQKTYIITADTNAGNKAGVDVVTAGSKEVAATDRTPLIPAVQMGFEGTVYFKLNPNSEALKNFMNQICLHDHCWDLSAGGGFDKMLAQYFRPSIENAIRTEAGKYDYQSMWHDPVVRAQITKEIQPALADDINKSIGGEYFCGPDATTTHCTDFGFILSAVTPPQVVLDSFSSVAAAQQGAEKSRQEAAGTVAKAQGDATAQGLRAGAPQVSPGNVAYIRAQAEQSCAANPNCHMVIVDGGSGSNVQVQGG